MNPWDVLNIKETEDDRLINKAYLQQLALYENTGNKDGIVRLKLSYKLILHLKNSQNNDYEQAVDYPPSKTLTDIKSKQKPKQVVIKKGDSQLFSKKELRPVEDFLNHINHIALKKHKQPLNLSHWKFIKSYKNSIDINLHDYTEQKVFSLIAGINSQSVEDTSTLVVPMRVIKFMAGVFDWDNQLKKYKQELDTAKIHIMYPETRTVLERVKRLSKPISIKKSTLVDLNITARVGVFIGQMLLYSTPVLIYYYFTNWTLFELVKHIFISDMIIRFVLEIIANPLLTLSENNVEGQTFIIREDLSTPTILQTLFRHFMINLTFFPVYAWLFGCFSGDSIVIYNYTLSYGLWTTIMINIITANILSILIYGKLFHDLLTKTYAIQLRKIPK